MNSIENDSICTQPSHQQDEQDIVILKSESSVSALERVKLAISEARPFSLIRFNDGEAAIMGARRDVPDESVEFVLNFWWKQKVLDWEQIEWLRDELIKSANSANVLGFFDSSLHPDVQEKFLLSGKFLRKYCQLNLPESFVSPEVALDWHDQNLIASFVNGLSLVTLLTSRDIAPQFASKFNVETVIWLPIPTEAAYAKDYQLCYSHYPKRMEALIDCIQPLKPGHLFLVGAGVLGKIYCRIIKERGGIAIDLGSVFEQWICNTKRGSVRQHRQGF